MDNNNESFVDKNETAQEDVNSVTAEMEAVPAEPIELNNEGVSVDSPISSVESGEAEEMPEAESEDEPKKEKKGLSFIVRVALTTLFMSIFVVAAFMIASNVYKGYEAKRENDAMKEDFFEGVDRTGLLDYLSPAVLDTSLPKYGNPRTISNSTDYDVIDTNNQFFNQFKEKLIEYQAINPDVFGWIQIDGTNISYPCVKGTDNDFYLDRTATLEYNANGAIFADFRCSDNILENPNLVFYGHNSIYPGQMFHELTRFLDEEFFKNNRYVTIYTTEGAYRYEIFSIYETHSTYRYCQLSFTSNSSFVNWCNEMKTNSLYRTSMSDFTAKSRILTLSTCTNGYFTQRYSLQAKLVSVET